MPSNKRSIFPKDNPEWTPERIARAKPFRQMFPKAGTSSVTVVPDPAAPLPSTQRRSRGLSVGAADRAPGRERIAIRLSPDVIAGLRATGPGWTMLADDILRAGLRRLRSKASGAA